MAEKEFKPGEVAPESGLYFVRHLEHRDEHEVTLIAAEQFPPCSVCMDSVRFRISKAAKTIAEDKNFQTRKSARRH
jgi:YjzC-like protein